MSLAVLIILIGLAVIPMTNLYYAHTVSWITKESLVSELSREFAILYVLHN